MKALSLFSSAGIGELGLLSNDIEIIAANELLGNRCSLYRENHPNTHMFEGDIWELKEQIVNYVRQELAGSELFMVYATPPCQGMSTNGYGKLQAEIAAGRRSEVDDRNRLIIPALEIISKLNPRWVLFENVPGMKNTLVDYRGEPRNILDLIADTLGPDYCGSGEVVSCSDYGVPQLRKRLLTIFTRDENGKRYHKGNAGSFLTDDDRTDPVSLWDAIGHLPPLDARDGLNKRLDFNPLHYVSVMSDEKYWWVSNTPEGETAFNNQCSRADCGFQGNRRHVDVKENGRWTSSKNTPLYCEQCGNLLPRPSIVDPDTGQRRLIRGFHSAYRRMERNLPARTLTRNFPFEASDNKIHPEQNRVLSVYEALVLQTISEYDYNWTIGSKPVTRSLIAQAIGESVPPKLIERVTRKIISVTKSETEISAQQELFA